MVSNDILLSEYGVFFVVLVLTGADKYSFVQYDLHIFQVQSKCHTLVE